MTKETVALQTQDMAFSISGRLQDFVNELASSDISESKWDRSFAINRLSEINTMKGINTTARWWMLTK